MDESDPCSENGESTSDGVKKRILKLIERFKLVTYKDQTQTDSGNVISCNSNHETKHGTDLFCDVYDFSHPKRGYAVFIINSKFDQQSKRPYADDDYKHMLELFVMLDFEVILLENKTSKELWTQLKDIKEKIGNDCDCLACIISSHGAEVPARSTTSKTRSRQHVIFTKDGILQTSMIMEVFNNNHCPTLEGKPRMFFIQACRSIFGTDTNVSEVDQGFEFELVEETIRDEIVPLKLKMKRSIFRKFRKESAADTQGRTEDYVAIDQSKFKTGDRVEICEIPCFEDYLVMFSSSPEKIAWSDCGKGGWLIYCLYEVFKHLLDTDSYVNLLQILTSVCRKMALELKTNTPSSKVYHQSKSAATIHHMLTKDIILKPVVHHMVYVRPPVRETAV